jgi:hypothetical protein
MATFDQRWQSLRVYKIDAKNHLYRISDATVDIWRFLER